jgi:hypothetical protein
MKYIGIREVLSSYSVWCHDDMFDVSTYRFSYDIAVVGCTLWPLAMILGIVYEDVVVTNKTR